MLAVVRLACAAVLLVAASRLSGCWRRPQTALPIIVNTWAFTNATDAAWETLQASQSATALLDAVEEACSVCEAEQCDGSVGFGGSPDERGETTLDAMLMDGDTMSVGAVGNLGGIRSAARAARLVLDKTRHSLLTGSQARLFARQMGLPEEDTATEASRDMHARWQRDSCQPNFWMPQTVSPEPTEFCGPYESTGSAATSAAPSASLGSSTASFPSLLSHDTIAVVAVDAAGRVAAGASTNGAIHKIPGRVGDAAVPGAGAYATSGVGGCGSTGDGDVHLRFLPCATAVELLRRGRSPEQAAREVVARMARAQPGYVGAVVVVDARGRHAGAGFGWAFRYSVRGGREKKTRVIDVEELRPGDLEETWAWKRWRGWLWDA